MSRISRKFDFYVNAFPEMSAHMCVAVSHEFGYSPSKANRTPDPYACICEWEI